MKLWRKASDRLKDKNSIYLAKLARRTAYRNPDIETAIIKATSHDESRIDYKNAQRVFAWIRTSSTSLKPLVWSLSTRMEKTRCWVVALKGLLLMHGIFCCKIPSVRKIGRLPFDLSNFHDGHSTSVKTWGLSAFVRAYFAFLDQKSAFDALQYEEGQRQKRRDESSTMQMLVELQRLQALLDLLMQVRPYMDVIYVRLVLEAMDCIVIEIFDVYSRICNGIAAVLVDILEASRLEAKIALKILQKAGSQGEELTSYFEFCKEIGVISPSEFPRVDQIPEEDIRDLEKLINGASERQKAIEDGEGKEEHNESSSKTIITENWVTFEDEFKANVENEKNQICCLMIEEAPSGETCVEDPFAASVNFPPPLICGTGGYNDHQGGGGLGLGYGPYGSSNGFMQLEQYYCNYSNPMGSTALSINNNDHQRNLVLSIY